MRLSNLHKICNAKKLIQNNKKIIDQNIIYYFPSFLISYFILLNYFNVSLANC